MVRALLTFGPVFCLLLGCGYKLGARGLALAGVRTVHVPALANDTKEPGIHHLFTRALREELAARARLKLAPAGAADVIAVGRVKAYTRTGMAFPVSNPGGPPRVGEFRAVAVGEVLFKRRADGKVLFSTGDIAVTGELLIGPDVIGSETNRERVTRQLAADFARRATELIADSF